MTSDKRSQLWKEMVQRSFNPREWFEEGERPEVLEGTLMWVYRKEAGRYVVGFYSPDREWHEDSAYSHQSQAAQRVNFLNGGSTAEAGLQQTA